MKKSDIIYSSAVCGNYQKPIVSHIVVSVERGFADSPSEGTTIDDINEKDYGSF